MKAVKRHWTKFAGALALASLLLCAMQVCISAWGQSAPGLKIALVASNEVSLTITNGSTNTVYNLYFTEYLGRTWSLIDIGAVGQTNFSNVFDTRNGFYKATINTNTLPIVLTVTIVSPANGSIVY